MRRSGQVVAALSAAALLLAVWVTSTQTVQLLRADPSHRAELPPGMRPTHHRSRPSALERLVPPQDNGTTPAAVYIIGDILLGLVAAGLLVFLVSAVVQRARRERFVPPAEAPADSGAVSALETPAPLTRAAAAQAHALRAGSPRNAIVACWMALEQACADSGLPRHRAETSTEFTARVLASYTVGDRAVTQLAALYREARFSTHDLTEQHRDRAVSAVEAILADLRRPVPRAAEPVSTS